MTLNDEKWSKIEDFQFEKSPQEYGFVTRLAYENGWTEFFTKQAIFEYKKFMYLVSNSSEMLSPSEIVDTVWHQHLIYSESYKNFCTLLGKEIKHIPSTHHAEEKTLFSEAFVRTEKLYKENFDASGWKFWKIKNDLELLSFTHSSSSSISPFQLFLVATFLGTLIVYNLLRPIIIKIDNPYFIIGYLFLFGIMMVSLYQYAKIYLKKILLSKDNLLLEKLSVNELICLKTKNVQPLVDIALCSLVKENQLKILNDELTVIHKRISKTVLEKAVRNCFQKTQFLDYGYIVKRLKVKNCFLQYLKSTKKITDFIKKSKEYQKLEYHICIVFSLFISVGLGRYFIGMSRQKPIFILLFVLVILCLVFLYFYKTKLNFLFHSLLVQPTKKNSETEENQDMSLAFLLIGSSVFGNEWLAYTASHNRYLADGSYHSNSDSGSSSSSSDSGSSCSSGSSCGSSCGGCGGD